MSGRRVAVVGAGVSGLSAAWALHQAGIEVVVYERDTRPGGHAKTATLRGLDAMAGGELRVETGVQVVCPAMYPHISAMARRLGIRFIPYAAAYTVANGPDARCGVNHQHTAWWRELEADAVRFTVEMSELMALSSVEVISWSVGEYLASHDYSEAFIAFMRQIAALIGPQEPEKELEVSLVVFATAVDKGFVSLLSRSSHEMAIEGGVSTFIDALARPLGDRVRLGCGAQKVWRRAEGVEVHDTAGGVATFDDVALCVDGPLALSLLGDPDPVEENLLSSGQVHEYTGVLHEDATALIPDVPAASRTYIEVRDGVTSINFSVMNLERRRLDAPLLLTYEMSGASSGEGQIDASKVRLRTPYRQTKDSVYAFELKRNLFRIQGARRTWFASAWTTMCTFEHAAVSGLVIAEALGAPYGFAADLHAAATYQVHRALMLDGTENFPLSVL